MKKLCTAIARMFTSTLIALTTSAAAQADYPNRPVRLVSGYAPGGTTSIVGRLIGQRLTDSWGQQFILDNRPGGGTLIGAAIVAKAPPDGYTLMLVDSAHVLAPLLLNASYDPIKDFTTIATVASSELVLVVHPSIPPNNLAELIDYAKPRPGKLTYASPAIAGAQHLATEMFNAAAAIQLRHVPYKSAGPALIALVSGEIDMYFATIATGTPYVKAGKAKSIAVTGATRSPLLPDVPTFGEAGLTSFYSQKRPGYGIVGPARVPKPIVDKISSEVAKHLAQRQFRESLLNLGLEPKVSTPQEYADALKSNQAWNIDTIATLRKKGVKFDF
ncbi:MAG TPA: tripartite tricarboxylate transporter substrate binding protein [Burkholderiales bacterium]|jgi:tripartite-type tricarboxylate transporter receptor subunit TctC